MMKPRIGQARWWSNRVFRLPLFVFVALLATGATEAELSDKTNSEGATTPQFVDLWDPYRSDRDIWGPVPSNPEMRPRMAHHWVFIQEGPPDAYRGIRNPLEASAEDIAAGRDLYATHCALCHGANGEGDGRMAHALRPSPALLAYLIQRPFSVDEYVYWSIAEGGEKFGSLMPAFKSTLEAQEIWQIISFMRGGFPPEH